MHRFESRAQLDRHVEILQALTDRHDILRTAFIWDGVPEPVQVVLRHVPLPVQELHLDPGDGDIGQQLYERFNPRRYRLDLRHAPPLRLAIARDPAFERWLLLLVLHHMAGDHTTLAVLSEEGRAYLSGQEASLEAPHPFRNLVAQARLGLTHEEHEAFFRRLLGDIDEPTAPMGLLSIQGDGRDVEDTEMLLDAEVSRQLRAVARAMGVSVASVCHVAWAQALARLTGRSDVVFGTVLSGRMQSGPGADRTMGLFINTLPVRITIGDQSAEVTLRHTHRQLAELLHHEHASLALAQRCSAVSPPLPLFTTLLNYRHSAAAPRAGARGRAVPTRRFGGSEERTNYPLTLSVDDLGEDLRLKAQVRRPIDGPRVCHYMRQALESLAHAVQSAPATPVCRLAVLPDAEYAQVVFGWNDARLPFPDDLCIHELFEAQVDRTPNQPAVVSEAGALSYSELNQRANQLARELRGVGVAPKARVAICLERGFDLIIAILAVLKAGGAYVPLDPTYPEERLRFMLDDSEPSAVLTHTSLRSLFSEVPLGVPVLDVTAPTLPRRDRPATNLERPGDLGATDLAYLMYTSGSTGQPKGVMVEHRSVVRLVQNANYVDFKLPFTMGQISNIAFDASTFEIWGALLNGGQLAVISKMDLLQPADFGRQLRALNVSVLFLTTALFQELVKTRPGVLSGIRQLLFGGEACDYQIVRAASQDQPGRRLVHVYGPTETTSFASFFPVTDLEARTVVPIGRPISNTQLYILDQHQQAVPVGVPGELYIGGPGVARGYWRRPELTAERFLADPFGSGVGDRLYKTGDRARWLPDGNVEFIGRNDNQVKLRGFRIELGEIDARLSEYPGVHQAVVLLREDTPGRKRLVAYYTSDAGAQVSAAELRSHLQTCLPEHMVPFAYVQLGVMPFTPNGKLDRAALPPPDHLGSSAAAHQMPTGDVESTLARIWAELLQREQIGRHDDFFAHGGHSILAIRLVHLAEQSGIGMSISDVFSYPTIASLAPHLVMRQGRDSGDRAVLIRQGSSASPPLFFAHEGTGMLTYVHGLAPHINSEISIYGLPPTPADALQQRTVEAMASRMIDMMRAVQPSGPYRVAGWSFGGLLAYEIATQLIGVDEDVEFVGLLDTFYPPRVGDVSRVVTEPFNEKERLLLLAQRVAHTAGGDDSVQQRVERVRASADSMSFDDLVALCQDLSLVPGRLADATPEQMRHSLARVHAIVQAYVHYRPERLSIPVHFFLAREEGRHRAVSGWEIVPEDLLRIVRVPGTHHSMMDQPHVDQVARALSEAIACPAARPDPPERAYKALTVLQTGGGSRVAPLFCVAGAGDAVTSLLDLAAALGNERPVWALQARGVDGGLVPHATVAAAAVAYLKELDARHPRGAVHLLGHSFGGWVVFEMALRLTAAGREVGSLTLLDADAPQDDLVEPPEYSHIDAVLQWIGVVEMMAGQSLGIGRADLEAKSDVEELSLLHDRLSRSGLRSRRADPEALRGPLRAFASCLRTRYQPGETYRGAVRLAVADSSCVSASSEPEARTCLERPWRRWAPQLTCVHSPANHLTMLKRPHVDDLVRLLELV